MAKKGESAPSAPDPSMMIGQQTQANGQAAVTQGLMNRVNQVTPYGTLTYDKTGAVNMPGYEVPTYTATTKLSPEQQRLYETQTRVTQGAYDLADQYTGRIGDATKDPFSYEGLPNAPTYNEGYRQQQRDAIIARNQPDMTRDQEALRTRLANQGIGLGTEAWGAAQDDMNRGVNDFRLGADLSAGSAAAQQYGLEANTRDRAIQERVNLRTQPINEVAALLGTGQGVQNPNFINTPQTQMQPTDVMGAYGQQYAGQMAQWQQGQKAQSGMMGGLFGLGAAGIGAAGMII
ncbi:MAG: hypothetical protein Q8R02_23470 [Hyphomonadaceae bacterium]|nr:hypothetical protein [Hyphomonadaceae bacterium]